MSTGALLKVVESARMLEHPSAAVSETHRMNRNALADLEFSDKTRKRAQWEAFEFAVPVEGTVVVTNASYGDEDELGEHTYAVNVNDGVPTDCVCSADKYQRGACKHRVAVAITAPVLEAATTDRTDADDEAALATDGGAVVDASPQGEQAETTHAPGCDNPDCEGLDTDADRPLLSFECWDQWAAYNEDEAAVRSIEEVDI